jgi:hypothetical protein
MSEWVYSMSKEVTGRGKRMCSEKLVPVALCSTQLPWMAYDLIRSFAVMARLTPRPMWLPKGKAVFVIKKNYKKGCVIPGCRLDVYETSALLCYDAASSWKWMYSCAYS